MKQRTVLVTGAGGFVGTALSHGFADLGWRVIGLDRDFADGWGCDGIRRVTADLAEGVPADLTKVDLVVHAAWVTTDPGVLGITPAEYVGLNIRPLLAALEYATRTRPAAFVFLSSSGVFAPGDATEGLTDKHQPTGSSPYAAAKRAGELLVLAALDGGASSATAVHVVRLGHLFGPGEASRPSRLRLSLVAAWLAAARDGQPLMVRADDPQRDWTLTTDLAAALERVVEGRPAGHAVHLGSPHIQRDRALASLIASHFPGAETVATPAAGPVKPPMIPSDLPSLRDFIWTSPDAGLRVLLTAELAPT